MKDQPLGEVLEAIAGREPAPGAGAAAGIALALGLACVRKAVGITLAHHPEVGCPVTLGPALAALAEQALPLGDEDAVLFAASLAGDADAEALQAFGRHALAMTEAARAEIARAAPVIHDTLRGDIVAAQALMDAAATIFTANLRESASSSLRGA